MKPKIHISVVRGPELKIDVASLRLDAWLRSTHRITAVLKRVEAWQEDDDQSPDTYHFLASVDGKVVGAARIVIHHDPKLPLFPGEIMDENLDVPMPCACLGRLVVMPEYRGQGIGGLLQLARLEWIIERKITHALVIAVGFGRQESLIKQGFVPLALAPMEHHCELQNNETCMLMMAKLEHLKAIALPAVLNVEKEQIASRPPESLSL